MPKRRLRPGIRAVLIGLAIGTTAAAGYTAYRKAVIEDKKAKLQEISDAIDIQFNGNNVIEYGDKFDEYKDVEAKGGELSVSGKVDTSKTGEQHLLYTIGAEEEKYGQIVTKDFPRAIIVEDSKAPVISLENDTYTITEGDAFDVAEHVKSVKDPVDGDLPREEEEKPGSYRISTDLDTETAGEYTVTITAIDKNGNKADASYKVMVEEKPEETVAANTTSSASRSTEPVSYTHGTVLTPSAGTIQGPSGKETYYNLDMSGVVRNARAAGIGGDYWVRSDGAKMLGDYIICACDVTGTVRNRYDIVETSLGTGICLDTGGFAAGNPSQIDIATSW